MRTTRRTAGRWISGTLVLGLAGLTPLLMGGCPEYRNSIVDTFEEATRSYLSGTEEDTVRANARFSFIDATVSLFFDQFRTDDY